MMIYNMVINKYLALLDCKMFNNNQKNNRKKAKKFGGLKKTL